MAEIVLASGSPRRAELLTMAGYAFEVMKTDTDENVEAENPAELVKMLSMRKAADAAAHTDKVIIAADTVVALDGKVLGKPADASDAKRMLRKLSGRSHSVYTGITVRRGDVVVCEAHETKVYMREIDESEINAYAATGSPLDKAGAYGIQDMAGMFVSRLEGDYYTVVGLPLCRVSEILKTKFEITPTEK
jgi:septum formation protein